MQIAPLTAADHSDDLAVFFGQAADYVTLETGAPPDGNTVAGFFADAPPDCPPNRQVHLGLFDGKTIIGVLAMSFGYPQADDSYIGYLVLAQSARGHGRGALLLAHATEISRARGASRQLVAVLGANPKGRAFWEREGFTLEQTFPDTGDGHIRHRLTRAV